ncbi:MAG: Txe/YoeB family addiction module toxin [Oscillospiraceae bacterium]|nr:Txe/YoeB family addiction module toxin [Oscillospiraceae bacterium]
MILQWDIDAWDDYIYWQTQDKKTLKKINALIKDICRNPYEGIGKPEPLKGNLSGFYSRHIDEKERIVYAVSDDKIIIIACRTHYNDK